MKKIISCPENGATMKDVPDQEKLGREETKLVKICWEFALK